MDEKCEEDVSTLADRMQLIAVDTSCVESVRLLDKVISNSLVGKKILSYLSFGDMKSASEVSQNFNNLIRDSQRFQANAVLRVTEDSDDIRDVYVNSDYTWRGVLIDVTLPLKTLESVGHILPNIEFLSLVMSSSSSDNKKDYVEAVLTTLRLTSRLSCLRIDLRLLEIIAFDEVLICPEVQTNLKELRRLDILEWNNNAGNFHERNSNSWVLMCGKDKENCLRNFQKLMELPKRLESFRMADKRNWRNIVFEKFIPTILKNNFETLVEISVHSKVWAEEELRTIQLLNLKSLVATIDADYTEEQEIMSAFLTNHPLLEELDIRVNKQTDQCLLNAIKERCPKLKKFHLKSKLFSGFEDMGGADWSFLAGMKHLKDFKIARPSVRVPDFDLYGTGPQFLSSLPKNQLETLSFKGISNDGFWEESDKEEPELIFKTDLLQGFRNLKRLSFVRCDDAVDDQVMQFILREFQSLEELEVSHCRYLTNAGINRDSGEGGLSIQTLQGLKLLSIRACLLVTQEGILSCVKLPYLKKFEYWTINCVSQSFVVALAKQNPSLETIGVNMIEMMDKKEMKETNGRLAKIIDLGRSWIDEDSDSDGDRSDVYEPNLDYSIHYDQYGDSYGEDSEDYDVDYDSDYGRRCAE